MADRAVVEDKAKYSWYRDLSGYQWFVVTMHKALDHVANAQAPHLPKSNAGEFTLAENPFPPPKSR